MEDMDTEEPMTTNILIHMKNNMMKSLWNSKFAGPFRAPIDDEVHRLFCDKLWFAEFVSAFCE